MKSGILHKIRELIWNGCSGRTASLRAMVLAIALTICLSDATAWAIGSDPLSLALLGKISATEVSSLAELQSILRNTLKFTSDIREVKDLSVAAYRGIEDLRYMTWQDAFGQVKQGFLHEMPEVAEVYGNVASLGSLRRSDPRAMETLRGMLFTHVYGPAISAMHGKQANLEAIAQATDMRARHTGIAQSLDVTLEALRANCEKGAGEGACAAAANRSAVYQAQILNDMHQMQLKSVALQERELEERDAQDMRSQEIRSRFLQDFSDQVSDTLGTERHCIAGRCLWGKYAYSGERYLEDLKRYHRSQRRD